MKLLGRPSVSLLASRLLTVTALACALRPGTAAAQPGSTYFGVTPCRIFDTRLAAGPLGGPSIAASQVRLFSIGGNCGVPLTATAVSANLVVTDPAASGFLRVFPSDVAEPNTNTISFSAGQTRAGNGLFLLATDGSGTLAFHNLSLGAIDVVFDVTGFFDDTCPPITVNPPSLASVPDGTPVNATLTASGGSAPVSFTVTSGALPGGVNLSSSGVLSGTATAGGSFNFTATATDFNGCTGSRAYTLVIVCPTITVSPSTIPPGAVGVPYGPVQFTQTGGVGAVTWSFTGALPTGVNLSATGVLSGTPTQAGSFPITVKATDAGGCFGTVDVVLSTCPTITVNPANPTLPAGTEGSPYNQIFTATGGSGSYTFAVTAGALPAPLNLSSAGVLSGTPTVAGDFSFTVTATDANGCKGSRAYTLHLACGTLAVSITPTPAQVCASSAGNAASAPAGFATYAWSITNGTITSPANAPAITYTAGASGNVGLTVNVTDASACPGQATLNVPINANPATPTILTSNPQRFTVIAASGTFTLTFSGQTTSSLAFNATAASVQTALDALSSVGGAGGSTAVVQAGNVYTVTFLGTLTGPQPQLTASGFGGATIVVDPPLVCSGSTGNLARGPAGATTYAWSITNGTITSATNIQTITYTAGASGNVGLTLTVTNAAGCAAQNSLNVPIIPALATPTITPTPAQVCGGSTGNTAAGPAGFTTYAWSITNGTITSATDIQTITYTAGASGNVTLDLTVTNASGCGASNSVQVPINASPSTPTITPTPAQVCVSSTGNQASGPAGATSYAWTATNGTITSATNIQTITYSAGAVGNVTLNLTVTNAAGCAASNSALVPINANPATPTILTSNPQTFTVSGVSGTFTLTFNGQTTAPLAFNATAASVQTALNALSTIGGVGGSIAVTQAGGFYTVTFGATLTGPQPQLTASGAGGATVIVDPPSVCADSTGNFARGPAGAAIYAWSITNGTITSAPNIQTITYTAGSSGNVGLTLTITNPGGCSATNSLNVPINPVPATPTITPTPAQVCADSTGNTADGPAGATTYAWSITNGTITSATDVQTITYTAGSSGNVTLNLTVTNSSHCPASNSLDVPINPGPAVPTITPTPATVCANVAGNTASGPAGATTYAWSIVNGTISSATNIQTITYTAGASGTVDLTLVVTNAQGCSASNTVNVPINPIPAFTPAAGALPVATFNVAYSLTFAGTVGTAPFTFALASGALPTGMTLNSNGTVSPNTPSVTGPFAFSITVTDANGCSSTHAYTLNVQPNLGTDAYSGVGNTQFFITGVSGAPSTPAVSSATTVLANDTPGGIAVTAGTTACGGIGGSITMDAVGRFVYTPPVGVTGIANCTYTGTSNTISATGAINITLANMVWWVDNATASGTNDGRSNTPFKTMTAVNGAATNNGDFIYVFKGSGTTTGTYTMKPGQQLIGAGATLNVPTISPLVTIAGVDGNTPTIGGTITLAGNVTVAGIDMNTDASNGIAGTSVSGVIVTVRNVATTTGTGVTIGGSGNSGTFLFRSIASNGAVNGISLTNTTGSFTVTGDGASDPANTTRGRTTAKLGGGSLTLSSGGTIQNTTGPAISLTTATNVTLQNVSLTGNAGGVNSGADGIHAQSVTGLTLDNVLVIGHLGNDGLFGSGVSGLALQHVDIHSNAKTAGVDALDIWNVRLDNLTGTSTAANSLFFDSLEDIFTISNNNSTLTMTITNSEFRDTSFAGSGNTAFAMIASGSSVTTITATGSTFKNAKTTGFQYAGNNTSSGTVKVMNSIFGGTAAGGDAANQNGVDVDIAHQGAGTTLNFEVSGNTMRQGFRANDSTSINIFLGGLSTAGTQMIGTVKNNVVGIAGTANSGSDLGAGIALDTTGAGTLTASVTGNSVNQVRANSGNVFDAGIAGTSKLDLFLHNNVFNGNPAQVNPQYGLHINNGTGTPGETSQLCLDMGANTVTMPASAIASIDLDAFGGTTSNLVGYAGAANNAAQIQAFFTSVNTSTTPATLATLAGGTVQGSAGCGVTFPSIVSLGNETQ